MHSAGGPPPGDGPGELACQHVPKGGLTSDQTVAVGKIAGPQLKAGPAVADGPTPSSDTTLSSELSVKVVDTSGTSDTKPDAALVSSASAALPHLQAAASASSAA